MFFTKMNVVADINIDAIVINGVGNAPVIAVIEPRSNTMRLGSHQAKLAGSTADADQVFWYQPEGLDWSLDAVVADSPVPAQVLNNTDAIINQVAATAEPGSHVVIMSNGGFDGGTDIQGG